MKLTSKRAENLSLISGLLTTVFFVVTLLLGRWSGFSAIFQIGWLILSAALVWLILWVQFHQRSLADQEKLDISLLQKEKDSETIFQANGRRTDIFAIAEKRLQLLEKWFLPIFSSLLAVYQMVIGFYLIRTIPAQDYLAAKQPLVCAIWMTAIAFVAFLFSRYATGMSTQEKWRPLRAGGSFLLAVAILCFIAAIALSLSQFKIFILIKIIKWVVPCVLIAIGFEIAFNVVLDIYRPRLSGRYNKAAFDSRLLAAISEPGGLFHTAADTIDYQFGFKVSQTWFYKLLEKAILPLILFSGLTLYLLSSIVIVSPNEQAVIEHYGNPLDICGQVRLVGPGLSVKQPWPIDIAYKYPVGKIHELCIGYVPKEYKEGEKREPLLWGKSHHQEEYKLLVASGQSAGVDSAGAVPVSLIMASIPVQYKVNDLYAFLYNHEDSARLLEDICYRELTSFAASSTIEVDSEADIEHSLFGAGRTYAKDTLTERIQLAADEQALGVEVVFVGLQGLHPPPEVAADYQMVVGAVQKKQALILNAQAMSNGTLSALVGSVEKADQLHKLAIEYQDAIEGKSDDEKKQIAENIDRAFGEAKGDIFETLRKSKSYAFEKAAIAKADGVRFESQLAAYMAAPEIYLKEQRLAVFEQTLGNVRKYVVVADQNDTQVFIVDVKEKITPSLYELGGLEENTEQ